jgi:hypothetical protein
MNEIIFIVSEPPEGGYAAEALGESIFAVAETLDELSEMVRDSVICHFEEERRPKIIRLHFVREELIAVRGCHGNSEGKTSSKLWAC